ncbi:MAG: amidohydrolase [Deltaproteobacteria bacterium]|jgi:amidohydrolase
MPKPDWSSQIEALLPELVAIRHDIHRHPELGFEEHRTQAKVRAWLEQHGYAPRVSAETGLVADLGADRPGEAIAFRADLDCLPMQEHTDLPYRSVHDGRAHKCGHDGHTTILMGVAAVLAKHADALTRPVRLIFQPAEEGVRGGGARVMVEEGAVERVAEVYGLHNWPGYPKGEVRVKAGALMAQVHTFELTVRGVGGHGSQPQLCVDPIVASAHLIVALQTIVSRSIAYDDQAVVSVGAMHAGKADNIIPDVAHLKGTIRTFDPNVTERVLERLHAVVNGVAATHGVSIETNIITGYPVLMNDSTCAEVVREVAAEVVGSEHVKSDDLPMAGGEDFAYFCEATRGAYFFLGAKRGEEKTPVCHHPDFDFDDDLIATGVQMFLRIAERRAMGGA